MASATLPPNSRWASPALSSPLPGRVGQRPAQPRAGGQHADDCEQVVADRGRPGAAGTQQRLQPLPPAGQRSPGSGPAIRPLLPRPAVPAWPSPGRPGTARRRRRCRASSSSDSPTILDASSVASVPTSPAQLDHRLLALGLDLLLGGRGDPVRLGLRLLAHLRDDLAPWVRASSRILGRLGAGVRELAAGTPLSAAAASAWAASAFSMPPSIAAVRSAKIFSIRGTTRVGDHPVQDREGDQTEDQLTGVRQHRLRVGPEAFPPSAAREQCSDEHSSLVTPRAFHASARSVAVSG